jgi:nucleotide-binding universal stress UspA family protein
VDGLISRIAITIVGIALVVAGVLVGVSSAGGGTFDPEIPRARGDDCAMPETAPAEPPRPAPDPLPWKMPGILVGIDGSGASRAALRYAATIAPKLDVPLHALLIWDYPAVDLGAQGSYYPDNEGGLTEDARSLAAGELSRVFSDEVPAWATAGERRGRAASELINASREAALLVVGARGHGGFVGLLLGSVSDACVSHAHCPVLVVRAQ